MNYPCQYSCRPKNKPQQLLELLTSELEGLTLGLIRWKPRPVERDHSYDLTGRNGPSGEESLTWGRTSQVASSFIDYS